MQKEYYVLHNQELLGHFYRYEEAKTFAEGEAKKKPFALINITELKAYYILNELTFRSQDTK